MKYDEDNVLDCHNVDDLEYEAGGFFADDEEDMKFVVENNVNSSIGVFKGVHGNKIIVSHKSILFDCDEEFNLFYPISRKEYFERIKGEK